jgi:hypothetical protein
MPAGKGLKTRRQQIAFAARIAAPEQATRASVVRALPQSALREPSAIATQASKIC